MSRVDISLLGLIACLSWSSASVLTKYLLGTITPLVLLVIQVSSSGLTLLVFALARHGTSRTFRAWRLAWLGFLQPGVAYGLSTYGLQQTSASVEVLVWALDPLFVIALAWAVLDERPTRWLLAAMVICLIGNLLVALGEARTAGMTGSVFAIALITSGVAASALYTVMLSRSGAEDPIVLIVFWNQVGGLITFLAWWTIVGETPPRLPAMSLVLAGLSGVLLHGLPFIILGLMLREMSAGSAGFVTPVVSVLTMAIAHLALGERLVLLQNLGAMIIILGTCLLPLSFASERRVTRRKE